MSGRIAGRGVCPSPDGKLIESIGLDLSAPGERAATSIAAAGLAGSIGETAALHVLAPGHLAWICAGNSTEKYAACLRVN